MKTPVESKTSVVARNKGNPDRRSALLWGGGALAAASMAPGPRPLLQAARPDPRTPGELARALIECNFCAAATLFADAIAAGVGRPVLFGAVLVTGVPAMRPRVVSAASTPTPPTAPLRSPSPTTNVASTALRSRTPKS